MGQSKFQVGDLVREVKWAQPYRVVRVQVGNDFVLSEGSWKSERKYYAYIVAQVHDPHAEYHLLEDEIVPSDE